MKKDEKQNRRKFLSLGLLSGAAIFTQSVQAEASPAKEEETMMLLTADGKLVEVKKSTIQKARSGNKVSNQEILKWTNPPKTKS